MNMYIDLYSNLYTYYEDENAFELKVHVVSHETNKNAFEKSTASE